MALAAKETCHDEALLDYLMRLPSFVRHGVHLPEAVTIARICRAESNIALVLAKKFGEFASNRLSVSAWLQQLTIEEIQNWLPNEPQLTLNDLWVRFQSLRRRDWALRREGRVVVELAGWKEYEWPQVERVIRLKRTIKVVSSSRS